MRQKTLFKDVDLEMETMLPTAAISVDTVRFLPNRMVCFCAMSIWSCVGLRAVGAPIAKEMSMFCCSSIAFS